MTIRELIQREFECAYINEMDNSLVIDCGGCDFEFLRILNLINEHMEEWTYEDLKALKIEIDTAFERIKITGDI